MSARDRGRPVRSLRALRTRRAGSHCGTSRSAAGDVIWGGAQPRSRRRRRDDSLRLEKGYRVWGSDITPDETPYEAGLGFAVKLDKGDFLGREALLEPSVPERRLVCLVLDDARSVALGSEPVRVDGEIAGRVTSGGYGYTVERSIAYAYVPGEAAAAGRRVEVEIFGEWVGGVVADEPLFDPAGERIRRSNL
jgi:4-methylaminobutanoate oxidase (formaldehyde-forming)